MTIIDLRELPIDTNEGTVYIYRGHKPVAGPFLTKAQAQQWIDKLNA